MNLPLPPRTSERAASEELKLVSAERFRELDIPQLLALWHGGDTNRERALEIADIDAARNRGDRT